jgi:ParB family chromosome partitioning protein
MTPKPKVVAPKATSPKGASAKAATPRAPDAKKERPSRFGGMGSVLAQHRLLEAALGPGEGALDASSGATAGGAAPTLARAASSAVSSAPSPAAAPASRTPERTPGRKGTGAAAGAPNAPATPPATRPAAERPGREGETAATPATAAVAAERVFETIGGRFGGLVTERPVDDVRRSPFQPTGRPSATAARAVERAIGEAGSLEALVGTEGALQFARLDTEAARLAELAFDIQVHGVKEPVVTRTAEDGAEECLSGHRRLVAARLAGLATVPVLSRGPMSNANAAATVLSGNLHREPFTTWQEAVLVTEVRERRLAEQMPADVRTLSRVMGWASGKAQARLKLRRAVSDALLERLGDPALVERIGRLGTKELNRIADTPEEARRLALLRRALGVPDAAGARVTDHGDHVVAQRPRRGGGFVLEVRREIEAMPLDELTAVRHALEAQLTRVTARMTALGGARR